MVNWSSKAGQALILFRSGFHAIISTLLAELRQVFAGEPITIIIEFVNIPNTFANAVIVAGLRLSLFRKIRAVKLVPVAWTNHDNARSKGWENGR